MAARFISYYVAAARAQTAARRRAAFDLVQVVEGYAPLGDISYVHYCHRSFLRHHWDQAKPSGPRSLVRKADHLLRAAVEGRTLQKARYFVVPSPQLGEELRDEYGFAPERVLVVPNPVDVAKMMRPPDFSRDKLRAKLGCSPRELLIAFVALGHFERKGLPLLLEAMLAAGDAPIRLVVVGGRADVVASYRSRARDLGVAERVRLVGWQPDVRPFLWASDAFASPSAYEVFALAPLQAAAAGLPLIVTSLPGVAPFFRDTVHGFAVTRDPANVADAFTRLAALDTGQLMRMGTNARRAAEEFDVPRFVASWRAVYATALRSERR